MTIFLAVYMAASVCLLAASGIVQWRKLGTDAGSYQVVHVGPVKPGEFATIAESFDVLPQFTDGRVVEQNEDGTTLLDVDGDLYWVPSHVVGPWSIPVKLEWR